MSERKRVVMVLDLTDEGTVFPVPVEEAPWTGMPSPVELADAVVAWLREEAFGDAHDNLMTLAIQIEQARERAGRGE